MNIARYTRPGEEFNIFCAANKYWRKQVFIERYENGWEMTCGRSSFVLEQNLKALVSFGCSFVVCFRLFSIQNYGLV